MKPVSFGAGRLALLFGSQKVNLHKSGYEFEPKAENVQVGSADLCFISNTSIDKAREHIKNQGVEIIEGSGQRTGAVGKIISIYFRDPDGNLIEVSNYQRTYILNQPTAFWFGCILRVRHGLKRLCENRLNPTHEIIKLLQLIPEI